ncbi:MULTISPECIES: hypothetical protein [Candidatus Ichthyocystis]|uniref:hypothetical protein n=1 Tax=Candidatus Ichthyocystis TaxID=2929841 RepID=UPI000B8A2A28|nr:MULTISPECIES: hypothetical protein [Ichthyocystis]
MNTNSKSDISKICSDKIIDDDYAPFSLRSPINPSSSICRDFRAALHDEGDDHMLSNTDTKQDSREFLEIKTLQDSPLIKMPIQRNGILVLTLQQRIEWNKIEDRIRVRLQQGDRRKRYEITLSKGVFKGTLIKIFYDEKWFVIDIKTTPPVRPIISSQVCDLIDRLFSLSVNWVRVFLRYHSQSRSLGQFWTGTNGVIRCCGNKG